MTSKKWANVAKITCVIMWVSAFVDAYLGQFILMLYCMLVSYFEILLAEKLEGKDD